MSADQTNNRAATGRSSLHSSDPIAVKLVAPRPSPAPGLERLVTSNGPAGWQLAAAAPTEQKPVSEQPAQVSESANKVTKAALESAADPTRKPDPQSANASEAPINPVPVAVNEAETRSFSEPPGVPETVTPAPRPETDVTHGPESAAERLPTERTYGSLPGLLQRRSFAGAAEEPPAVLRADAGDVWKNSLTVPDWSGEVSGRPGRLASLPSGAESGQVGGTQKSTDEQNSDSEIEWRRQYAQQLRRAIGRHQTYPRQAVRRRQEGTVELRFHVLPSGAIGQVVVTGTSGYPVLDTAASALVSGLDPLQPFTDDLQTEPRHLVFELPVVYRLR